MARPKKNATEITAEQNVKTTTTRKRKSADSDVVPKKNKTKEVATAKDSSDNYELDEKENSIKLSNEIYLKRDRCCMWLEEVTINQKTGKPYMRRISGYYGKDQFAHLFKSFVAIRFRTIDATKPTELLKKMKDTEEQCFAMIDKLTSVLENHNGK